MTTVNTGGNEQVLIEQMQAKIAELEETIRVLEKQVNALERVAHYLAPDEAAP